MVKKLAVSRAYPESLTISASGHRWELALYMPITGLRSANSPVQFR